MENVLADRAPVRLRRPARLLRLTSDERLVALVRSGDEGAFEALYDRHHPAILGFCRHMLGTREEAEDAVQHTFLAAFRNLVGSEKPIDLRPWLFAIARNRCLSLLRARRAHVAIELAEPSTDGLATTVERREDLRELLADLARLPEDQRAALLLAELGALDHAGIASVLDCPREKVKALVFQARTSLAASREARATPCEDIRVELATASGAALRRGPLRRHLRTCDGCRAFKAEVATQRKLLALALPVVPGVALKASVLGGGASASAGGPAAATTAAVTGAPASGMLGGLLGTAATTGAGKVAVSLAVAGAVAGGGAFTAQLEQHGATHATSAPSHARPLPHGSSALTAGGAPTRHGVSPLAPTFRPTPAPTSPGQTHLPPARPVGVRAPGVTAPPHVEVPAPASGEPGAGRAPAPATHEPDNRPVHRAGEERHHGGVSEPTRGTLPPHHANGTPHRSEPPGHGKTTTGRSQPAPGHSQTAPGRSETAPGHTKTPEGQGRTTPASESHPGGGPPASAPSGGHSSHGSTGGGSGSGSPSSGAGTSSPGQSGFSPGQVGASPGQSGSLPGQSGASPGQSGASPSPSGTSPGQSGSSHGQSGSPHGYVG